MKRFFLFLAIFFLLFPPLSPVRADDETPEIILIEEGGSNYGGPVYHAPAIIPIQCVYYSSITTIEVQYLVDLGPVLVEIENQTTGEYSYSLNNVQTGSVPFVITGTSGTWTISFTLSTGTNYCGSFEINN